MKSDVTSMFSVLLLVLATACQSTGLSPKDCLAVSNWRAAAQEYYFDINSSERIRTNGYEAWFDEVRDAFFDLGNVTLPTRPSNSESTLIELLNLHTEELEEIIWAMSGEGLDVFDTKEREILEANKNIRAINNLLVEECWLEPLRLYQAHPAYER